MANARFARFMVTFTVPADDYKHKHIMVVHHIDDELDLRRHYAGGRRVRRGGHRQPEHGNRGGGEVEGDDGRAAGPRSREPEEAVMKESGDEYRPLDKSEMLLNQEQVDNLRADFNELLATHGVEAAGVTAGGGEV
jgi:hypothetical protein